MGKRNRLDELAQGIKAFVEAPLTELVKGLILMIIGILEASRTFHEDLAHGRLRVGHGLVIIGFFGVLSALPHIIEGLQASTRYLEFREEEKQVEDLAGR